MRTLILALVLPFVSMAASARPALVGVDTVQSVEFTQTLPLVGQVVAANQGSVSATVAGQVASVDVKVGEAVKQGEVLLTLNTDRLKARLAQQQAQLKQAQASLKLARLELARVNELKDRSAFSQSEVDRRQSAVDAGIAQVATAQANLQLIQIDLDESQIRAPFDAVVAAKNTQLGAWLNRGQAAMELVSVTGNEVVVDVPSLNASALRAGVSVTARSSAGQALDLTLRSVLPIEDGATRTRPSRFTLNQELAVGARVTVQLPVSAPRSVLGVHKDAILRRGPQAMVYVVQDGKANMRPVQLGESVGNRLEVLDGLAEGEVVVIKGNERLRPGQEVAPQGDRS